MSCFRGQMNEYTSIAIDRFDGKNLQCTVFLLSHCHKDHMMGLNSPQLFHLLHSREDIFIYCTEISRLLLLAEEMYQPLEKYIRVLDISVSQPVRVPSNSLLKMDYCVNVTPIPAGHCPGSVMFLFEGCEGTSLYTGDFRWEINQVSKIAAFRHEDGSNKKIKSLYVDTTFCIPEAYQIPSRISCVEATAALVSDWLHQSLLHVMSIFCPARYGHEHLLMELALRLDTKIHVPDWKVKIYDEIPDLQGVFTSNPAEARIHSCSAGMGHRSSHLLPCRHIPPLGGRFRLLNIRPSTMWFTSEKSRSRTEDLIVTPASNKGVHRVCYSMHSSYSEIRDLVSYLQPECVLPNVLPMSDASMEIVKKRLIGFLSYPHKSRIKGPIEDNSHKPLGILKQRPNNDIPVPLAGSGSSDELVFSSQEQSPKKTTSVCALEVTKVYQQPSPQALYKRSQSSNSTIKEEGERLQSSHSLHYSSSKSESSYNGSVNNDEELDLFDDEGKHVTLTSVEIPNETTVCCYNQRSENEEESFRLYVSGDSDVSDDDDDVGADDSDLDVSEFSDYGLFKKNLENTTANESNPPEVKTSFVSVEKDKCVDKLSLNCGKVPSDLDTMDLNSISNENFGDICVCVQAKAGSSVPLENKEINCLNVSKDEDVENRCNQDNDVDDDDDGDDEDVIPSSQGTPTKTTPRYCKGRTHFFKDVQRQEKYAQMSNLQDSCIGSPKENASSKDQECLFSGNLMLNCPSSVSSPEKEKGPEYVTNKDVVVLSSLEDTQSSQSSESQMIWDKSCDEFDSSKTLDSAIQHFSVKTTRGKDKSKACLVHLKSRSCDKDKGVIFSNDEHIFPEQDTVCVSTDTVSSVSNNTTTLGGSKLTASEQHLGSDVYKESGTVSLKRKFNTATQGTKKTKHQIHCTSLENETHPVVIDIEDEDAVHVFKMKEESISLQGKSAVETKSSVDEDGSSFDKFECSSTYVDSLSGIAKPWKCKKSSNEKSPPKSVFLFAKKRFCQSQTSNSSIMTQQQSTSSEQLGFSHMPRERKTEQLTKTDCLMKIGGKSKISPMSEYLDLTEAEQKIVLDLTEDNSP